MENAKVLMVLVILIVSSIVGVATVYKIKQLTNEVNNLNRENEQLKVENLKLRENLTKLQNEIFQLILNVNASNAESIDPRLKILSCEVTSSFELLYEIKVTVKNVGNEFLKTVYVFLIIEEGYNVYTGGYSYCKVLHNLWTGEEATVVFTLFSVPPFKVVAVAPP